MRKSHHYPKKGFFSPIRIFIWSLLKLTHIEEEKREKGKKKRKPTLLPWPTRHKANYKK